MNESTRPPGLRGEFLSDQRCDFMLVTPKRPPPAAAADTTGQQFFKELLPYCSIKARNLHIKEILYLM